MSNLRIADGFTLPLELVTSTQAILARKRSGKSYTASVQAEELLKHKQQIAVIDPTSAWWGLRSSADGEGPGYPVVVFGGDHADAPLDPRAGRAMAKAVVEHGFSAIFDIGNLHTEEQVQFVMEFCSEMLRINHSAIHIFMDEADTFAPQKPLGLQQNKCLGTVSRLVKQGGIKGIGFTMITQRPQSINKDVLSQVDILTVLRMSHPLDVKAATDWIKSEVTVEFAKQVETALPGLAVGTAFFCSAPLGLGQRVQVRQRETFNSGATPKPGERKVEPKVLAKVDIEKLGQQIADSVKRAEEDSPGFLKKRIGELERQIADGGTADMAGLTEQIQAMEQELAELRPLRNEVEAAKREAQDRAARLNAFLLQLRRMVDEYDAGDKAWESWRPPAVVVAAPLEPYRDSLLYPDSSKIPQPRPPVLPSATVTHDGINPPQQRILNAMATLHAIRGARVTLEWVACTAGATPRARGFEENMRILKNKGLIDGIRLTEAGAAIAHADATRPTFHAVLDRLAKSLSEPQAHILNVVKRRPIPASELAAEVGTTERARGFEENIRKLRSRNLLVLLQGRYHVVDWLQSLP